MARSKSSRAWLQRQFADIYVKRAQSEGWRSRAAFKLLELNEKKSFIRPGMIVVDLGSAPGGWSQVTAHLVQHKGQVFALDILPMDQIAGVEFLQGDFREESIMQRLLSLLGDRRVDLVLSDMSPNLSGHKHIDQPRSMYLAELALDFAKQTLSPEGIFLVKVFQGAEFDQYLRTLRQHFQSVASCKPQASRSTSREIYLLAQKPTWFD